MKKGLFILILCGCTGSLVDHSALNGTECQGGRLKCALGQGGCCDVTALSAGTSHTCAVVAGEARCWGANDNGQLGNGGTSSTEIPQPVVF